MLITGAVVLSLWLANTDEDVPVLLQAVRGEDNVGTRDDEHL